MIDDFKLRPLESIILNTDLSGNPGVHWIVLTGLKNSFAHIFDSLGSKNPRKDADGNITDKILFDRLRSQGYNRIHFYPYKVQLIDSSACGNFSIFTAKLIQSLLKEDPNLSPESLDSAIISQFGKTASQKDERLLAKLFS